MMNYKTSYGIYYPNFDMTDQYTFATMTEAHLHAQAQSWQYEIITIQSI